MFGEDFVQAVTDRVTFAVQHFDGQVLCIYDDDDFDDDDADDYDDFEYYDDYYD